MLATSALDPSFGTGGLVVGAVDTGSGPALSQVSAIAVQADGKVVEVGTYQTPSSQGSDSSVFMLAARRYNADGSLDTSFGSNGQVTIPLPASATLGVEEAPQNVIVQANGTIDLAASGYHQGQSDSVPTGFIAQLTAAGQLDSTFGTNGELVLPDGDTISNIAVQGDGKLVASGERQYPTQILVVRATTAGTLDTTFAGTGEAAFPIKPLADEASVTGFNSVGVVVDSNGLITVAGTQNYVFVPSTVHHGLLAQITSTGTLNTSYGSSGLLYLGSGTVSGAALQADNKVVITGNFSLPGATGQSLLARFLPTGAADPSFQALPAYTPGTYYDYFQSVAVAADGSIVVTSLSNVQRFTASGQVDTTFGTYGRATVPVALLGTVQFSSQTYAGVAFAPTTTAAGATQDRVVVALNNTKTTPGSYINSDQAVLARLLPVRVFVTATNDFDGDGKSDIAAELTANAIYAYRQSNGTGDVLQQFGQKGFGASIPVSGDFDGDGRPDVAVYIPSMGDYAYRSSANGHDILTQFGPSGTGASIPAPGDYFGNGVTAMAVYIPAQGNFAIETPSGVGNVLVPFGIKGAGQSIPVPGDYDGDGVTDLAVYIPSQGVLAYRPSSGGPDVKVQFGPAGPGASIPAPGDYDGDGKTDVAVYIPSQGQFAVRPSSGAASYYIPFGTKGAYNSVPAPGDYDGDGKTDAAVYLPTQGVYAYRPSSGGNDVVQGFGQAGYGATVPVSSIPYAQPATSAGGTSAAPASGATGAVVYIPLTDDLTSPTNPTTTRKKASIMA